GALSLLARTTTMTAPNQTGLLVLLDTTPGDTERTVPFNSGLTTKRGDEALLLAGDRGWRADLATGAITELPAGSVATDPSGYRAGRATPTQYWLHFRGGNAHIAAAVAPGIFKDMGSDVHSIVITPDGRGTSGWYVGRSHVDFLEVWADSHHLFSIDRDRTYM